MSAMRVVFRADASLQIGSGHVMRCLTLAEALRGRGAECHFICREHPGHLLEVIRQRGFAVSALPAGVSGYQPSAEQGEPLPAHSAWLGCDWQTDARQTSEVLSTVQPDWLVLDHYALDLRWESAVKPHYRHLLVIDDLADRVHVCDLLLDQNLGREVHDYAGLVPEHCSVLAGPKYALLRPEFAALREYSLQRRQQPQLRNILITMGGVDQPNATGQVLEALKNCPLPDDCRISVIMGLQAPWLKQVKELAVTMPWPTEVLVNINDMAQRMVDCDLAIGAAGSTSWERCCLGVPTLMAVLADNQVEIGEALSRRGAAALIGNPVDNGFRTECIARLSEILFDEDKLKELSRASAAVADGAGGRIITEYMF
ncbi:UDP-2,4-diacetamido-2,4,6-trideoxy-beta-L-altropyranose hydrolase [Pseudomonas zhanjiangensis]|uniref:UDP-2,4-diacetamido-2,4, 6-trideoxy-beta-L-altropyranose hydrolase n=1 Tax=Pseudomonas zhanjiangensis TaxID=3239015 RepID=A0ABV3YS73_9PSED